MITKNLILLTALLCILSVGQSVINKGPENVANRLGSKVELECITDTEDCSSLDWQKDVPFLAPLILFRNGVAIGHANEPYYERYSIKSSDGGCSLVIDLLENNDSGVFSCTQVTSSSGQTTKSAILLVLDVQEKCELNVTVDDVVKGDFIQMSSRLVVTFDQLTAISATLSWIDKNGKTVNSTSANPSEISSSFTVEAKPNTNELYTSFASYQYPTTKLGSDNDGKLTFSVCTSAINVKYPPTNIRCDPSKTKYSRGSMLVCSADGNPNVTYSWRSLVLDQTVSDDDKMTVSETSRDGDQYQCVATNTIRGQQYVATWNITIGYENPCGGVCIALIIIFGILFPIAIAVLLICFFVKQCPLFPFIQSKLHSDSGKTNNKTDGMSSVPLNISDRPPPPKPPRSSYDTPPPKNI